MSRPHPVDGGYVILGVLSSGMRRVWRRVQGFRMVIGGKCPPALGRYAIGMPSRAGSAAKLEGWCRSVAAEAQKSPCCRGTIHMPTEPGGEDEVEDVVLREGRAIVLFSVKSSVMDAKAAREAISVAKTMEWYTDYFFEKKGNDYRGGAIRQIDARIRMIQNGKFAAQGIEPHARILPVIVTYDSLGETDALYKWLEICCVKENLLPRATGRSHHAGKDRRV